MVLTKTITAPLQAEMADRLDAWAEKHGKNRSWVIRTAVSQFLDREAYREKKILEALAAAENDDLLTQNELDRWIKSPHL
ncbi:CopG family ribbon-helix-helix protein [Enterobacter kobei]|uniref:CopG family ribbon-helix-helix protein n=1 Tax=Enterobacter kobei TaxID=208224 RepID=UPI0015D4F732|nr:ribbon-helix-helix domain-containing protein [Enterobacter kobei]